MPLTLLRLGRSSLPQYKYERVVKLVERGATRVAITRGSMNFLFFPPLVTGIHTETVHSTRRPICVS